MTREETLKLSDALVELGQSHTIEVGVHDNISPREHRMVKVTPMLSYEPTDITALQRLADAHGYAIAYMAGSFTFTRAK